MIRDLVVHRNEYEITPQSIRKAEHTVFHTSGRDVYKAHRSVTADSVWSFILFTGSVCHANGQHSSLESLLKSVQHKNVFVCETKEDVKRFLSDKL